MELESIVFWVRIAAGAAGLAGVVLLVLGWRGRKVDDHAYCRNCSYDLTGIESLTTCPECGATLTVSRAVRMGRYVHRPIMLVAGVFLSLLALGVGVPIVIAYVQGIEWIEHEPTSWVIDKTIRNPDDSDIGRRYYTELTRRLDAGVLSDDEVQAIVTYTLNIQSDAAHEWRPRFGTFIERAGSLGRVKEEDWRAYLMHNVKLTLHVRPRNRMGNPVPFEIVRKDKPVRMGDRTEGIVMLTVPTAASVGTGLIRPVNVDLGGQPVSPLQPNEDQFTNLPAAWIHDGQGYTFTRRWISAKQASSLHHDQPGDYRMALGLDMVAWDREARVVVGRWPITLQDEFTMVDVAESAFEMIDSPELKDAVTRAVRIQRMRVFLEDPKNYITLELDRADSPVPFMFDVMADINGELTYITTLDSRWMDSRITVEFPWQAHRAFGTRIAVDLVLQPNHEKALRSVHHPRLWNTPVRLEKVPVYWERW